MAAWPFFSQLLGRSVFFLFFFRTFFPLQWTRSSVAFSICVSFSVPTADCCCCPYVDVYHMIITSVFLFTSNPILAGVVAWLFSRISVEIVGQQTITTAKQTNKQTNKTNKKNEHQFRRRRLIHSQRVREGDPFYWVIFTEFSGAKPPPVPLRWFI